jgi:integrase
MEVDWATPIAFTLCDDRSSPLSLTLNDAAFGIIEARHAVRQGPYVLYSPMTGDRFKNVQGALLAAVKRAGLPKITWRMFRHTFAFRLTRDGVGIVAGEHFLIEQ